MKPLLWMRHGRLMEEAGGDGADGGGGGSGAFDAKAFQAQLLAEVNKSITAATKALRTEFSKRADPTPEPEPELTTKDDGKVNPQVKALEKRLADMAAKLDAESKARVETETKAKNERLSSTLKTELLKHVAPDRVDAAMRIFGPDVKYSEDGSMVGGSDETALADYIGAAISKHEYLLPPKQVGGAGATAGGRRVQAVDLDDIKPGMKADELARVRAEISRVAAETLRGQ